MHAADCGAASHPPESREKEVGRCSQAGPLQVMSSQAKEVKVAASANGDSSRASWEGKEFEQDALGLTTTPKPVSPEKLQLAVSGILTRTAHFPGSSGLPPVY